MLINFRKIIFRKIISSVFFATILMMGVTALSSYSYAADQAEAEEDGHSGGGMGFGFEFVELDPIILPIIDSSGVSQSINVIVAIEVKSLSYADQVRYMKPRLNDAILQAMYGSLNRHANLKGGVLQIAALKKDIKKVASRVLGDKIVNDVLLQVVQQRNV